jgi:hypothetical protein
METILVPLAVQNLEVQDPLQEEPVREIQLIPGDRLLIDNPDSASKSTEMGIESIRKNPEEDSGAQAVDIIEEFPSLVAT